MGGNTIGNSSFIQVNMVTYLYQIPSQNTGNGIGLSLALLIEEVGHQITALCTAMQFHANKAFEICFQTDLWNQIDWASFVKDNMHGKEDQLT